MFTQLSTTPPVKHLKPITAKSSLGGRTAWSTVATVNGQHYPARFWYDGTYIAQAKEDSAEMALRNLTGTVGTNQEPPPASYYARSS
jgi:hypothetical protein